MLASYDRRRRRRKGLYDVGGGGGRVGQELALES